MNRLSDNVSAGVVGQTTVLSDGGLTSVLINLKENDTVMFVADISANNQPQATLTAIIFAASDISGADRENILIVAGIEPAEAPEPEDPWKLVLETKAEDLPQNKSWVGVEIIETAGLPNEAAVTILAVAANKRKRYSNVIDADRRIATFPE